MRDEAKCFRNKGKPIHELSERQHRRKLSECKSYAQQALWFCETFGLQLEFLGLQNSTGEPVKMALTSDSANTWKSISTTESAHADHSQICQVLYVLDRFAVSDQAYHELSTISDMPPLHQIKRKRLALNSTVELHRISGKFVGAFRPVKAAIEEQMGRMVKIHSVL